MKKCNKCNKIIWFWQEVIEEVIANGETVFIHKKCAEEKKEEVKLNRKERRKIQAQLKKKNKEKVEKKEDNIPQQKCIPSVQEQESNVIPAEDVVSDETETIPYSSEEQQTSPPGNVQDQSEEVNLKEDQPKV
jgi:hypothetical protein